MTPLTITSRIREGGIYTDMAPTQKGLLLFPARPQIAEGGPTTVLGVLLQWTA